MLKRIMRLIRGKPPIEIPDSAGLAEGEARTVTLGDPMNDGLQVLLCRLNGEIHALDTLCPHGEGGRLIRGPLMDGEHAYCPLHHYRFDPKTGDAVGVSCRSAKKFRVEERDGKFFLWA
ncbi:MAG: nitrite reductase/ring-hydroxylating ferredoxin subunit [Planctomycetota bacterium]|jgi:nitrite reductase/ring-hydroxylating ferredoxin subunit